MGTETSKPGCAKRSCGNANSYYDAAEQMSDALSFSLVLLGRVAAGAKVNEDQLKAAKLANEAALSAFWSLEPSSSNET
jgi:hypothetical protein